MIASSNEGAIKALSLWPNTDYLNIWVVHGIAGGALGYATMPGASASLDGIVMDSGALGVASNSGELTHQLGHFFDLYHTYEGGSTTNCPPNDDCNIDGDRVCDTPPHKNPDGGCDVTGLNSCDNNSPNELVAHNYMNSTDNSCKSEFTPGQVMRMRCALDALRPTLTYSIGCVPGCTITTADFSFPSTDVAIGTTVTFTNTSVNATSYSWLIFGEEVSTDPNLVHTFNDGGIFEICLDATGPEGCLSRKCVSITVFPNCIDPNDPCEKVINGNFEQIAAGTGSANVTTQVCGWEATATTPFYCSLPSNNSIGLLISRMDIEMLSSMLPLNLEPNSDFVISFDYYVTNDSPNSILIALTENIPSGALPSDANIIAEITTPPVDDIGGLNVSCHPTDAVFHHYSETFNYSGDGKLFLSITGTPGLFVLPNGDIVPFGSSIIFIDNISISSCDVPQCTPVPDFVHDTKDCETTFSGFTTGDEGDYSWNFGDGTTAVGQNVTHTYLFGGTFPVCLTITCKEATERSFTICDTITIPDDCNRCDTLPKNVIATLCEDSGDTTNTYLANFDFEVPKGFKGCRDDDNLFTWSDEVAIVLESFEIDESDPDHDLIDVAILLTPPAGYDFVTEGATGIITLCDSTGNMICRQFNIEAQTCDACQPEVTSVASCADTNPNDDVFVYEGSVTVTILGGSNIATCGVISQEVGFSVSYSQIGNDWTINYSITTSEEGFTQTSALLCFYHQVDQTKTCIPLTITVESPCPPPFPPLPTDCVANWDPKEMTCTGEGEGNVIFHIPNMSVTGAPYSLCEEGLFGTVDGGSGGQVVVNSASFYGGVLFFDINILIPSQNFVSGQVYDVRLYLCDIFGNPVCYLFPYTLTCGGDGGTGGRPLGEFNPNGPISTYSILPNPATDKLIVISDQFDNEKEQEIRLFDHLGRLVKAAYLLSGKQEINVTDLHRGIYFVAILEGGLLVKVEKVAIIR